MRFHATRPLVRRMQAIDQALRAGRWPTDKSLAKELKVDPRSWRRCTTRHFSGVTHARSVSLRHPR